VTPLSDVPGFSEKKFSEQKLTILGLSRSGMAVARYAQRNGIQCFLSEMLPATPANEAARNELEALGVLVEMGGHSQRCFDFANTVVISPGIPPSSSIVQELTLSGKTVISEVEFAYQQSNQTVEGSPKRIPWIGITGTNGKTTTTELIASILKEAGWKAPACGNIGLPVTDVLNTQLQTQQTTPSLSPLDRLVIELSSFQLTFSPTIQCDVAVFTHITRDHLDWHGSFDHYRNAKTRLFTGSQSPRWSVLNLRDTVSGMIFTKTTGSVLWFSAAPDVVEKAHSENPDKYANRITVTNTGSQPDMVTLLQAGQPPVEFFPISTLKLFGAHNIENVLAAVGAAFLSGVPVGAITEACQQFPGVRHRIQYVATHNTIAFYNDSKATNPESTVCALRAFNAPADKVVLIAGGRDKLQPLEDLVSEIKHHTTHVVIIGEAQARFNEALLNGGVSSVCLASSLKDAVEQAMALSSGEPILFSPACSSFDMFKNFEERGEAFIHLVESLSEKMPSKQNASKTNSVDGALASSVG
jgi:UDP-N-acetylmuramoylalanine--D-glutamate ligase